jgi:hypothetical protein
MLERVGDSGRSAFGAQFRATKLRSLSRLGLRGHGGDSVAFSPGAAGITLYLIDQRAAPVAQIGDPARMANFEVARFDLTTHADAKSSKSTPAAKTARPN